MGGIVSAGDKPAFGRAVVQIGGEALRISTRHLEAAKNGSARFGDLFSRYADALLAQMMQSVACNALHTAVTGALAARGLIRTHRGQVEIVYRPGLDRTTCVVLPRGGGSLRAPAARSGRLIRPRSNAR